MISREEGINIMPEKICACLNIYTYTLDLLPGGYFVDSWPKTIIIATIVTGKAGSGIPEGGRARLTGRTAGEAMVPGKGELSCCCCLPCNHCSNWTWVVEETLANVNRLRSTHCRGVPLIETSLKLLNC